ncbi:MAG TPA: Nif3-like dinuclear metal center hexameric protein, partial [Polyangiaceae bacterium]|nr:Nif3-like dinuclear metal center hexameric protein [Polyangiaceae bacterium]
ERALVAIDADAAVLDEARSWGADLLIAYHPPLFSPLKRLRSAHPGERWVLEAVRSGITVYSPHTALDAATDGMADWLAAALGDGTSSPIAPRPEQPSVGGGRIVRLDVPVPFGDALERIKLHLGLGHLRASRAPDGPALVRSFAVCPGAGGSLFEKVGAVDLLLSGEMRHHDVLGRRARGTHVVLTDHTSSERGYLPTFARRLAEACPGLTVRVSERDREPLVLG